MHQEFWIKTPSRVQRIQLLPEDLDEIQAHAHGRATIERTEDGTWTLTFAWGKPLVCHDEDWVVDLGWDPWQAADEHSALAAVDAWGNPVYQQAETAMSVYSTHEPQA